MMLIKMKDVFRLMAAAIVLVGLAVPASAGIIVDNTADVTTSHQPTTSTLSIAQGFTMGHTAEPLTSIAAAVDPGASLALYTEVHGLPGTLITTLVDTGTHTAHGDEIYRPSAHETLAANQGYAVVMSGNGNLWGETTQAAHNVAGVMDTTYNVNLGGGWFPLSSGDRLQMQVNSVPEPSSMVTAMLGLVLCGAGVIHHHRRRRRLFHLRGA